MLPEKFTEIIEKYRTKIQKQSKHQFLPLWRLEFLFTELEPFVTEHQNFYGWLAVITAEKVLPIFQAEMHQEKAPERLIKLAKRVCRGSLGANSPRVIRYSEYIYHFAGNDWGDWDEEILSTRGYYAGIACDKALGEARGFRFLANWHKYNPNLNTFDSGIPSSTDTAGVASFAYAETSEERLEFWNWWFDIAIPKALEASSIVTP